ncbi:hypothetical protein C8R44DRAFT_615590, partial [Mycena epipterygia]
LLRYLAEKYAGQGTPLIPTGLKQKALFEQAASIEYANFLPSVTKVSIESLSKQRQNLPVDEAALAEAMSEFSAKLDVYKVILGKQKFMSGDNSVSFISSIGLPLADIFHLYYTPLLTDVGIHIMTSEDRPDVTRCELLRFLSFVGLRDACFRWHEIISQPTCVKLTAGMKSSGI